MIRFPENDTQERRNGTGSPAGATLDVAMTHPQTGVQQDAARFTRAAHRASGAATQPLTNIPSDGGTGAPRNGHNGSADVPRPTLPSSTEKTAPKPKKKHAKIVKWDKKKGALKIRLARTSGWRLLVQGSFTALCVYLGWRFVEYVNAAMNTTSGPLPTRPPGVEGFLPISGLMGLLDAFHQGHLNTIHPAATVLFVLFVGLSLALRKSFCGWMCPVGFVSENLARVGQILFKRNFRPWPWLDVALRSLKYLLLGFFGFAIFSMTPTVLHAFIASPYNKVADIKMLEFFARLSGGGLIVIALLAVASIFINGFWCRYLCPYGALMGLFSWMSPVKVRRDPVSCTDCGLCDKVCPARLPVMSKKEISSPECIGCNDCVTSCPVPTALWMGTKKRKIAPKRIALVISLVFVVGVIGARTAGIWQNNLTDDEVRYHVARMDSPEYGHPGR